jgi:threonine/homoserine/homoserine lactone efflux protein
MILESAVVAAIAFGLIRFLRTGWVIGTIAVVGGAVMWWMGQGMVRSAATLDLAATKSGRRSLHPVAAGIVMSLSNPYWSLWWATIGAGYLVMGLRLGWRGLLAFFAGHILSDFAWYTLVSTAAARGRAVLPEAAYRTAIAACGAALIGFAVFFVWRGTATLLGTPGGLVPAASAA